METFSTSGFELSALLAPELAGTAVRSGQGANGDPWAAEPGDAPFALALGAAASVEPEAATPPVGGNILPLFDLPLIAAQAVDPVPALPGHDLEPTLSVGPGSTSTVTSDPDVPLLTVATARAASTPIAMGADAAALPTAASSLAADSGSSSAAAAAVPLVADGAKLAPRAPDHAAEVIRLVTNDIEGRPGEPATDAPTQRSGEPVTGRAIPARDAPQPLALELSRQFPSAMTAADSANVSAATSIAQEFRRLDVGARASEPGAAMPTIAAIVTEATSAQSVDGPKLIAELPAGSEARLPSALAERLHWMIDQNLGEARIKLNPPQLGAIDIKITVADDQTFVQFTASQAGAREAIESALPRLRDLLGAAGLELGGATVGGEGMNREHPQIRWSSLPELEPLDVIEPLVRSSHLAHGQIDIYA